MLPEMKDLLLIVIVYSVIVFTILFIYGLIIFFKLRRTEREISVIKRNLDALLNSSGSTSKRKLDHKKGDSDEIEDSIVNGQDQFDVTKDEDFIKQTLKSSKSHVSPTTNSINKEMDPKIVPEKENKQFSADHADLKKKLLEMLYQYGKTISYEDFTKRLNENDSFTGKHNLVFDLIDQLAEEKIIEVGFAGGILVIDPKKS